MTSLEQLATALYVTSEDGASADKNRRALVLNELKPHISIEVAEASIERVDNLIKEASREGLRV